MPIYAYKCTSCGHEKDVLQKVSDAPLSECPVCGAASFAKQLTAAGFQLKGSGWYVTDFRNGSAKTESKPADGKDAGGKGGESTADGKAAAAGAGESKPAAEKPATPPATAPAPAAAGGGAA